MRMRFACLMAGILGVLTAETGLAQGPPPRQRAGRNLADVNTLVARMMKLDADQDGKLSQAEVKDERLRPLFTAADADHDGVLTRAELEAYFTEQLTKAEVARRNRPPGGPPREGFPGGPGGPGFRPPDGPPGPGAAPRD